MSFKIVRIIARLNIGGPARNAVLLTEGMSHSAERTPYHKGTGQVAHSNKYETVLVCGDVDETEGDMMYLAREKGIEPVIVKELDRELSIINDWRAFCKIYKIICREKPDIIHTHTAKAGALGRLAGGLYNIPLTLTLSPKGRGKGEGEKHRTILVHTFHGHVLHSYFGKFKTWFFIFIEKILALFTDRIITVSGALKKELIERFRIAPEKKFSVVELGFELDGLLGLPLRENTECVNIGIIGRLVKVKNHEMFLRVAKRVTSHESRVTVKCIVIGDGRLRSKLEGCVKQLGIEDMVEFREWVRDLEEIYRELDIVVLTSLNEGTPVSIIEAMAAGKPVVATNVGGISDIVKNGESGYLVKSKDEEAFTDRLLDLIKDENKRRRFGVYGRDLMKRRFSKERLIRDTEGVYSELLA